LVNVGGTVAPAAFAGLLAGRLEGWRARWRMVVVGAVCALPLATLTAWGELAVVGWPAALAAGVAAAAIAGALCRSPRESLAALSGAFALAAALWAVGAALGWVAWPAALGGGQAFDAGVVAWLTGQAAAQLAASGWPGRKPVAGTDSSAP
jgi:hypothetical protein